MANEFIVAIELGSSKITGIVGRKNMDNSISVLAVAQENSSECIRRGVVYNIDKTMVALINVKKRLEGQIHTKIRQVYVGVGGQSIVGVKNVVPREFAQETIVTQELVNELMDANRSMSYPEKDILDAITLEYSVNSQPQTDPVGIPCTRLEGNFLNILWRKTFFKNLRKCFEDAGIIVADLYIAPLALADCVLVEAERRAGCVLVDLGAVTTTVSVYYKNILRHIAVLPIGSGNITYDIAEELQMEERDAENMKRKYGCAYTENSEIDNNLSYPIDSERRVSAREFIEIVEARVMEIVENVWFQVPTEFKNRIRGGIVLTGGGANMKNMDGAFQQHTKVEKVRVAATIPQPVDATQAEVTSHDCRMNTALALLFKGNMDCAGDSLTNELFGEESSEPSPEPSPTPTHANTTIGTGVVNVPEEEHDDEPEPPTETAPRDSILKKIWRGLTNFVNTAISEEEE